LVYKGEKASLRNPTTFAISHIIVKQQKKELGMFLLGLLHSAFTIQKGVKMKLAALKTLDIFDFTLIADESSFSVTHISYNHIIKSVVRFTSRLFLKWATRREKNTL
jgi:hypothetical protein